MPFTPAHPAIVLPLIRLRYLSASGLVIGSLAPDYEYFFKMSVNSTHSHTLWGSLYFDVPVALLLAWLFHRFAKKNLILNLPGFIQRRLQDLLHADLGYILRHHAPAFLFSAWLGAASHIFWDAFTHGDGFFVRELPFYKGAYVPYDGVKYPLFYALQHISTGVGLFLIIVYIALKKPAVGRDHHRPNLYYWLSLLAVAAVVVEIRFLLRPADFNLGNLVVSCISGLSVALVVCGWINFAQHGQKDAAGTSR